MLLAGAVATPVHAAPSAPPAAAPPAVVVAPAPPPTVVVAPAAPAPVVVAPTPPAPVVVAPAAAPPTVVVAPAAAPPTVVVAPAPAPAIVVAPAPAVPEVVVVKDNDAGVTIVVEGSDEDEEVVIEEVEETEHHHTDLRWAGLSVSTVFSPVPSTGSVSEAVGRLNANKFRACLRPRGKSTCGYVKGFDVKIQMFESDHGRDYPTVVGYFRSGYTAGRVDVDSGSNDFIPGQVTSMRYVSVPLYFGGNIYAFGDFPVRPYAGMGAGFDILRLDYRRSGEDRKLDASGRIGFELHAGVEARISNFVSLHVEVMQLWSARRKLSGVPDFSNTGLSALAGVSVAIPTNLRDYREHHHERTVRRTKRVVKH